MNTPADNSAKASADELGQAKTLALRYLTSAPRTRYQVQQRLEQQEISEDSITEVLDRLERAGIIDDADFAQRWVYTRSTHRGKARSVIRQELISKGVPAAVIDEALSQLSDDIEREQARALAREKISQGLRRAMRAGRPDTASTSASARELLDFETQQRLKRQAHGFLMRRGYSSAVCLSVIDEEMNSVREE